MLSLYASTANTIIFRGKKVLDGIKINKYVIRDTKADKNAVFLLFLHSQQNSGKILQKFTSTKRVISSKQK